MLGKEYTHVPVMLREVVNCVLGSSSGIYVDATYGRGGHCRGLLGRLSDKAMVIALDRDLSAIRAANSLAVEDPRIIPVHSSYSKLQKVLGNLGIASAEGILMDLGVSSPQLDDPERGFSFKNKGPLDMRMDQTLKLTADSWINNAKENLIESTLRKLGEENQGRAIAREIVRRRPLRTTTELSDIVVGVKRSKFQTKKKHPATKTFQALRMVVNSELEELSEGLRTAFDCLSIGGRLVVVSFHSHEDRLVKSFFKELCSVSRELPRRIPVREDKILPKAKIIERPIKPSQKEINLNPRARSATMRAVEKIRDSKT